jgi:hypothetical protein
LTPIWFERFNRYKIIVDSEMKQIQFTDDDELEDFYSQYGYDPDEQSTETQNKALSLMTDINWKDWYENIFHEQEQEQEQEQDKKKDKKKEKDKKKDKKKEQSLYIYKDDFKFSY